MQRPFNPHFPNIAQAINELQDCPLKDSGITPVQPVGDGSSGLMLIGEAPGAKEDELGEPFLGRSGDLLNKELLPSIGLTRETVYITNIVKCRPPDNRDPTTHEKNIWKPVLIEEIKIVRPKVIATLGRHSLSFFIPKPVISKLHGTPQELNMPELQELEKVTLLPLYHPAYALYNPNNKATLLKDFQVIKTLI